MDASQLHRLCGITKLQTPKTRIRWTPVVLKFIGAESYVLRTMSTKLSLTTRDGGFGLMFVEPINVKSDALLGNKAKRGVLRDVVICFTEESTVPDLSLASLHQGMYPRVLRAGEVVNVA